MMDDSDPLNIRSGEDTDTDDERTNEGNAALHRGSMGSRGSRVLFRRLVGAGSGIDYNQFHKLVCKNTDVQCPGPLYVYVGSLTDHLWNLCCSTFWENSLRISVTSSRFPVSRT